MDAEERLVAAGASVEEFDFGREDEPDVVGCLLVERVEAGVRMHVSMRPGTSGERRSRFTEWAASRFQRFFEHGPEPDGWQKRSDMDDG